MEKGRDEMPLNRASLWGGEEEMRQEGASRCRQGKCDPPMVNKRLGLTQTQEKGQLTRWSKTTSHVVLGG